jgi:hypothetical protein
MLTGTTIMAVTYGEGADSGVIIGADSRVTTGAYVANRVSDKLTPVHDYIYCCRSGSTADTQFVADQIRFYLAQHAATLDGPPLVKTAAHLFQGLVYNNKDHLNASIICAGWDAVSESQVGGRGGLSRSLASLSSAGHLRWRSGFLSGLVVPSRLLFLPRALVRSCCPITPSGCLNVTPFPPVVSACLVPLSRALIVIVVLSLAQPTTQLLRWTCGDYD